MTQRLVVYDCKSRELLTDHPATDISHLRKQENVITWLDITDPQDSDIELLRRDFGFHPLALEDARKNHQRPKLDKYKDYVFMVAYHGQYDQTKHKFDTRELNLFIGKNFAVTVHEQRVPCLEPISERWQEYHEQMGEGAGFLVYLLIDAIVDDYFPALEALRGELDRLEDGIFDATDKDVLVATFDLKRELLRFRRMVVPLRNVFDNLVKEQLPHFGPQTVTYLQNIHDHLVVVADSIDMYRDVLTNTIDLAINLYMASISSRLDEVMKNLTVLSTCLMTAALITGVYGMNFHYMPELTWRFGYPYALCLMAVSVLGVIGLFRWRRYI